MPNDKALTALAKCIDSFKDLCVVLGPGWTVALVALVLGGLGFLAWWRAQKADSAWKRTLDAKEDMIRQLNEQNRELRVQAFVVGGKMTLQEATTLVYGSERSGAVEVKQ
jgi:hypothetical protein